jgi:hypothetical protein
VKRKSSSTAARSVGPPSHAAMTKVAVIETVVSIALPAVAETSAYCLFLSVAERALLLTIKYASTWPSREADHETDLCNSVPRTSGFFTLWSSPADANAARRSRPAFVPRTTGRRQETTRTAGASNPQVRNRIRASPQVVRSIPRTLSRWRHGFEPRWDYNRETAGHGISPESIRSLNRDSNAGYRLPAATAHGGHPDGTAAHGLDLPRHPQRVPASAVALRQQRRVERGAGWVFATPSSREHLLSVGRDGNVDRQEG